MISSYFDLRARRLDRLENEANAERRHQEMIEERRQERRWEEERRREERVLEEGRRREEERRHQELMVLLAAAMNGGSNRNDAQSDLIRSLQQTVADLQAENARLRQQNGNGNSAT